MSADSRGVPAAMLICPPSDATTKSVWGGVSFGAGAGDVYLVKVLPDTACGAPEPAPLSVVSFSPTRGGNGGSVSMKISAEELHNARIQLNSNGWVACC